MFKINRIIYLLFAMTMLCSCNSFLAEDTISEVPADKMWQTARDAKAV